MDLDITAGDDLVRDSLIYASMIFISFGIGWRLDDWLADGHMLPALLYSAVLFFIYTRWILASHR